MASTWESVELGTFLRQRSEMIEIEDDLEYRQVTVRIRGRGVGLRGVQPGAKIGTKRQFRITAGQLVVSKIDARNGAFGIVPAELDGAIVTQDFPVFDVDPSVSVPGFAGLVTCQPSFWDDCFLASEGSTNRVRLNISEFLRLEVDLPTLAEQSAIVGAVAIAAAALDAARAEHETAFGLLQAAVERLIVPSGSWDELPVGWTMMTLEEVAEIRSGITKGRRTEHEVMPLPFLRAANVQNGYLDLSEIKTIEVTKAEAARFRLEPGDVLMVEGSGSPDRLGRGWVWEGQVQDCLHQNHVFRARFDEGRVRPTFAAYAIGSSPARQHFRESAKTTSGLATINKSQVAAIPIPAPPIGEQDAIVGQLDAVRSFALSALRTADKLAEVRSSLAMALLSGERRLRETVAA